MIARDGSRIHTVYFDMDGVLADFVKFVEQKAGESIIAMNNREGDQVGDFIGRHIDESNLFLTLDPMPDFYIMKSLMNDIGLAHGSNIRILTSVGDIKTPKAIAQKKAWLEKNGICTKRFEFMYTFSSDAKGLFAEPGSLLIDDRSMCIEAFTENGGEAIKHENARETAKTLFNEYGYTPSIHMAYKMTKEGIC